VGVGTRTVPEAPAPHWRARTVSAATVAAELCRWSTLVSASSPWALSANDSPAASSVSRGVMETVTSYDAPFAPRTAKARPRP
jgi:hypothetical protein